jgi:hypothetical protein
MIGANAVNDRASDNMRPNNRSVIFQTSVLVLLCLAQRSRAADLQVAEEPLTPPLPPAFTATGLDVGFNAGYPWSASAGVEGFSFSGDGPSLPELLSAGKSPFLPQSWGLV